MVNVIWIILVLLSIWFIYVFGKDIIENKNNLEKVSWIKTGFIGETLDLQLASLC